MIHLTPDRLQALLEGTLPPDDAAALRPHLETDCPTCATALAEAPDLDVLLRLLEATGAPAEAPRDREALWAGIDGRLETAARPATAPSRAPRGAQRGVVLRWGPVLVGGVLAAGVLFAVLRPTPPVDPVRDPGGLKGDVPAPPTVSLAVLAGHLDDAGFQLEARLADGDRVDPSRTLLFEMNADKVGARYLFAVQGDGTVLQLFPPDGAVPALEAPGPRRVGPEGRWVSLSLHDVPGPVTLVAAASALPLDPVEDVLRPWQAHQPSTAVAWETLLVRYTP